MVNECQFLDFCLNPLYTNGKLYLGFAMSEDKTLCGKDLLKVLDSSRNPLKLAGVRNDALAYIKDNADKLPEGKSQACRDYIQNFDTLKRMSDQLRDLAVWIDEMNIYIKNGKSIDGAKK